MTTSPTYTQWPNKWESLCLIIEIGEEQEQKGRGSDRDGVLGSAWSCIKVSQVFE
jgi:hypothetical protein